MSEENTLLAQILEEIHRKRPRQEVVAALCARYDVVQQPFPVEHRLSIWQALLRVDAMSYNLLDQRIASTQHNLSNQRVIRMDAERTRAELPMFKTTWMQSRVQNVLTYYCKNREVEYKQGLHEVLAPFYLAGVAEEYASVVTDQNQAGHICDFSSIDADFGQRLLHRFPDAMVYQMLERMVAKFLARIYGSDDEFISLQCSLRLFWLLLRYHAPDLYAFLDQYTLPPELYATPWFLLVFARTLQLDLLLPLWDFLIVHATGRGLDGSRLTSVLEAFDAAAGFSRQQSESEHTTRTSSTSDRGCETNMNDTSQSKPNKSLERHLAPISTVSGLLASTTNRQIIPPVGPEILHFVAIAFVMSHRNAILHTYKAGPTGMPAELPTVLTKLTFRDQKHVQQVCADALHLYSQTPVTFRDQLFELCYGTKIPSSEKLLARLEERICVKISIDELLSAETKRGSPVARARAASAASPQSIDTKVTETKEKGTTGSIDESEIVPSPQFFLVDCRTKAQFDKGHLPTSFHFDADAFEDAERLEDIMYQFDGMKGLHIAVIGEGDHSKIYTRAKAYVNPYALTDSSLDICETADGQVLSTVLTTDGDSYQVDGIKNIPCRSDSYNSPSSVRKFTEKQNTPKLSSQASYKDNTSLNNSKSKEIAQPGQQINSKQANSKQNSSTRNFRERALNMKQKLIRRGKQNETNNNTGDLDSSLIISSANEDDDYSADDRTRHLLLFFLQRGFPYISEVQGGYTALSQHQSDDLEDILVSTSLTQSSPPKSENPSESPIVSNSPTTAVDAHVPGIPKSSFVAKVSQSWKNAIGGTIVPDVFIATSESGNKQNQNNDTPNSSIDELSKKADTLVMEDTAQSKISKQSQAVSSPGRWSSEKMNSERDALLRGWMHEPFQNESTSSYTENNKYIDKKASNQQNKKSETVIPSVSKYVASWQELGGTDQTDKANKTKTSIDNKNNTVGSSTSRERSGTTSLLHAARKQQLARMNKDRRTSATSKRKTAPGETYSSFIPESQRLHRLDRDEALLEAQTDDAEREWLIQARSSGRFRRTGSKRPSQTK